MTTVLFVLTGHSTLDLVGRRTGFYLRELAHAYRVFRDRSFHMVAVSPMGGEPPIEQDGIDPTDPDEAAFFLDSEAIALRHATARPHEVDPSSVDVVYYIGGLGVCWDVARDERIAKITSTVWDGGGVVAAVCHGVAGLLPVLLADGRPLVAERRVTGTSLEEESDIGLQDVLPLSVERALRGRGADYRKRGAWQPYVVVDGRLVTGQSAPSSRLTAERVVETVERLEAASPMFYSPT